MLGLDLSQKRDLSKHVGVSTKWVANIAQEDCREEGPVRGAYI